MIVYTYACAITVMVNLTPLPWDARDLEVKDIAAKRCGELFPQSPCLKRFTKLREQGYNVICASKQFLPK